jgi:hypothetical protein
VSISAELQRAEFQPVSHSPAITHIYPVPNVSFPDESCLLPGVRCRELADAEAAADKTTRDVHLAIARHFYLLAETEIGRFEGAQPPHLDRECDLDPIL